MTFPSASTLGDSFSKHTMEMRYSGQQEAFLLPVTDIKGIPANIYITQNLKVVGVRKWRKTYSGKWL